MLLYPFTCGTNNLPTHQAGGTLDLIITFSDYGVDQLTVDPAGVVSDHSLILFSLPDRHTPMLRLTRKVRSWRSIDRTEVYNAIVNSPVCRVPSPDTTADELFETYDRTLTYVHVTDKPKLIQSFRRRVQNTNIN